MTLPIVACPHCGSSEGWIYWCQFLRPAKKGNLDPVNFVHSQWCASGFAHEIGPCIEACKTCHETASGTMWCPWTADYHSYKQEK